MEVDEPAAPRGAFASEHVCSKTCCVENVAGNLYLCRTAGAQLPPLARRVGSRLVRMAARKRRE